MRRKKLKRRALSEGKPADYYLNPQAYAVTKPATTLDVQIAASDIKAYSQKKIKKVFKK